MKDSDGTAYRVCPNTINFALEEASHSNSALEAAATRELYSGGEGANRGRSKPPEMSPSEIRELLKGYVARGYFSEEQAQQMLQLKPNPPRKC